MNMLRNVIPFRRSPSMLAALIAGSLALGAASSAHAGGSFSITIGGCVPRYAEPRCVPVCPPPVVVRPCERPCISYAEAEKERGYSVGKDAGYDAGYRDGIRGFGYSDCPTASFCRVSNFYEDGYRCGFSRAYADGFQRGRAERRSCPPPPPCHRMPVRICR